MIEAELKARVRDPAGLEKRLEQLAAGERCTYRDTYYDRPVRDLAGDGRELRLRVISQGAQSRSLLTYKEAAVDAASGSKPEHETRVENPAAIDVLLRGVGLEPVLAFEKHCVNYRFTAQDRDMLATMVNVPELDGTFLELETITEPENVDKALADIRTVLSRLGVTAGDLTTEQYTDAVTQSRQTRT